MLAIVFSTERILDVTILHLNRPLSLIYTQESVTFLPSETGWKTDQFLNKLDLKTTLVSAIMRIFLTFISQSATSQSST